MAASFWKFYGLEYDQYKWTMPTSRFLGYVEKMNKSLEQTNETPHQKKVRQLMKNLGEEEYRKYYG